MMNTYPTGIGSATVLRLQGRERTQCLSVCMGNSDLVRACQSVQDLDALLDAGGGLCGKVRSVLGNSGAELVTEDGASDGNADDPPNELGEVDERSRLRNHVGAMGILSLDGDDGVLESATSAETKEDLVSVEGFGVGDLVLGKFPEYEGASDGSEERRAD